MFVMAEHVKGNHQNMYLMDLRSLSLVSVCYGINLSEIIIIIIPLGLSISALE